MGTRQGDRNLSSVPDSELGKHALNSLIKIKVMYSPNYSNITFKVGCISLINYL